MEMKKREGAELYHCSWKLISAPMTEKMEKDKGASPTLG
jgi:hypothetical protein